MNNMESKTDRWLRTGFIVFLIILLMVIIFSSTGKGSDVSNWIIAGANIAMAAAAVKAWRAARKFLSEFFAQEGYRLAIAFVNDNVIHLGFDNQFTVLAQKAFAICSELNNQPHEAENSVRLRSAVRNLEHLQNHHVSLLGNLRSLSFRMETYGIYAADDKKDTLAEMVIALDNLNRQGNDLLNFLVEDSRSYSEKIQSGSNLHFHFNSSHITEMKILMGEINKEWNVMVLNRKEFLSGGKHARTLFVVREN